MRRCVLLCSPQTLHFQLSWACCCGQCQSLLLCGPYQDGPPKISFSSFLCPEGNSLFLPFSLLFSCSSSLIYYTINLHLISLLQFCVSSFCLDGVRHCNCLAKAIRILLSGWNFHKSVHGSSISSCSSSVILFQTSLKNIRWEFP